MMFAPPVAKLQVKELFKPFLPGVSRIDGKMMMWRSLGNILA
jgi:hypothetical protein